MTSNRNAIADYLSYALISTGENINLCFIDGEIWANLNQISKIYDEDENTIKMIVTKIFEIVSNLVRNFVPEKSLKSIMLR